MELKELTRLTAPSSDGKNLTQVAIVTAGGTGKKVILQFRLDLAGDNKIFSDLSEPLAIDTAQRAVRAAVAQAVFSQRKVHRWFINVLQNEMALGFWRNHFCGRRGTEDGGRIWLEALDVCMYPCTNNQAGLLKRVRALDFDHMVISSGMLIVVKPMSCTEEQKLWSQKFKEPSRLFNPLSSGFFEEIGPRRAPEALAI
jgi:hypothetical protein